MSLKHGSGDGLFESTDVNGSGELPFFLFLFRKDVEGTDQVDGSDTDTHHHGWHLRWHGDSREWSTDGRYDLWRMLLRIHVLSFVFFC